MNLVTETIFNHRSIRSYKEDPVEEEKLDLIYKGIQAAPSSINGQQLSVIVVKDPSHKEEIAMLCGGQPWIAEAPVFMLFVADYHRAKIAADKNGEKLVITDSIESTMVSSVDIGLAMGNAIGIAESLGLGIVPIGAVRREPAAFIEMLELPEYVFPVAGLVVGYPKDLSALKPRLPQAAVIHEESYKSDLKELIDTYDEEMSIYMNKRTGGESDRNWSQTTASIYNRVYFPKVLPVLKEQGYKNEK